MGIFNVLRAFALMGALYLTSASVISVAGALVHKQAIDVTVNTAIAAFLWAVFWHLGTIQPSL